MFARLSFVLTVLLIPCSRASFAQESPATKTAPAITVRVDGDHPERAKQGLALFKSQVRGLLIKHCVECHGGTSTKADFDLATRKSLMESGLVEKSARDSHLVLLLTHEAEPHMPYKAPKLAEQEIAAIRKWIDLGAPYDQPLVEKKSGPPAPFEVTDADRDFWSFKPLQPGDPPTVNDSVWCRSAIDQFILAKLEAAGLKPNGLADPRTLLRRVHFGLTGLPPTPEETDAFIVASRQDQQAALDAVVGQLLDSPHYGERWGRHWMDIARFAESHGYEQDYNRPNAYHYRDFLIKALNADMPYDQFVRWQLAGDELAPDEPLALMATGFIGAGAFPTQLTEAEFESARYDELDDVVTTTGVAMLGLSLGCARCHDHKFDPISMEDYYSVASVFTKTIRSEIDVDLNPAANEQTRREHAAKVAELEAALKAFEQAELPGRFRTWLQEHPPESSFGPWTTLAGAAVSSSAGTNFSLQPDGTFLATGEAPAREVITATGTTTLKQISSIRLEALTHDSLPNRGPGRAGNGNFALGDLRVSIRQLADGKSAGEAVNAKLAAARATHQQNDSALSVAASIDDDPVSGWAVDAGGIGKDQAAVFDFAEPIATNGSVEVTVTLTLNHPNTKHTLGRFRVTVSSLSGLKPEVGQSGPPPEIVAALGNIHRAGGNGDVARSDWTAAINWYRATDAEWQQQTQTLDALKKKGPELQLAKVMVSSEGFPHMSHHADGRGFPHFYPQTHFLLRGDPKQKQHVVSPDFLEVLMPAQSKFADWRVEKPAGWDRTSFNRAALANWITDTQQGAGALAARVIVNRVWHHHFGRGIVASTNDFGFSGERPTHPELLDWLAADFVANGWSLKRLHRQILLSSVYQQSGDFDEARAIIDRENQLLWRRSPRRLEAEAIRDAMLAVSGQLDTTMFGPGSLDQNMKRRSVYFFIKRSQLIPMMMLFDWPEHLVSIGNRASTTIAPQALMFLNSPQGRQYATALASSLPGEDASKAVTAAYRTTLNRNPSDRELDLAIAFVNQQSAVYRSAGNGNPELQSLADLCQTIFGMNEFVYVE
jgi:mono/diheme cytochrome c family protein